MKMKPIVGAISAAAALTTATSHAQTFAETGDAGITEATAMVVPPMVNRITGTLKPGTDGPFGANPVDVDVYAFTLSGPTSVHIEARSVYFDMNLLLLREGFFGIYGDDDGGDGQDARIPSDGDPLVLPAGTYYVAVGINNIGAYPFGSSTAGDDDWDNDFGRLGPAEASIPIDFIGSESSSPTDSTGQPYAILFNFATVVTGLDLSVGKKPRKLRGVDVLGRLGPQTAKVGGKRAAAFTVRLSNTGGARRARTRLTKTTKGFDAIVVRERGKGNVTASFTAGRHRRPIASGETKTFRVKVKKTVKRKRGRIILLTNDTANGAFRDRARVRVRIRE